MRWGLTISLSLVSEMYCDPISSVVYSYYLTKFSDPQPSLQLLSLTVMTSVGVVVLSVVNFFDVVFVIFDVHLVVIVYVAVVVLIVVVVTE